MIGGTKLYRDMTVAADGVKPRGFRDTVRDIICCAYDNANETVYVEHAAPEEEWDRIFKGSIIDKLSNDDPDYLEPVHAWFATFGVKA